MGWQRLICVWWLFLCRETCSFVFPWFFALWSKDGIETGKAHLTWGWVAFRSQNLKKNNSCKFTFFCLISVFKKSSTFKMQQVSISDLCQHLVTQPYIVVCVFILNLDVEMKCTSLNSLRWVLPSEIRLQNILNHPKLVELQLGMFSLIILDWGLRIGILI